MQENVNRQCCSEAVKGQKRWQIEAVCFLLWFFFFLHVGFTLSKTACCSLHESPYVSNCSSVYICPLISGKHKMPGSHIDKEVDYHIQTAFTKVCK